jgi:hypothetical protein
LTGWAIIEGSYHRSFVLHADGVLFGLSLYSLTASTLHKLQGSSGSASLACVGPHHLMVAGFFSVELVWQICQQYRVCIVARQRGHPLFDFWVCCTCLLVAFVKQSMICNRLHVLKNTLCCHEILFQQTVPTCQSINHQH